jgi:hypothetical protein
MEMGTTTYNPAMVSDTKLLWIAMRGEGDWMIWG